MKPGLYGYIGAPGTGKTYLAREELLILCREQNVGALVVDSRRVEQLAMLRHADTIEEAIPLIYRDKEAIRWTPNNLDELERALRMILKAGKCALLIDEIRWWSPGGKKLPDAFLTLCRTWRHSQVSVFVTTQAITRDLGAELLACDLQLKIFRLTAPPSLEWVFRWMGLDTQQIRNLADRKFILAKI